MKTIKILTIAALCGSSISPIMMMPAFASAANSTTSSGMAATCAALVDASAKLHDGTPVWSTAVVDVAETEDAPVVTDTEVPNSRVGIGTPTYSGLSIARGPFRIGGSVNMFGDQVAATRTFASYNFKFDRSTAITTHYTFGCQLTEKTETWTPPVIIPGTPVQGFYTNPSENNGGGQGNGVEHGGGTGDNQSCSGFDYDHPKWGQTIGACIFTKTADATPPVTIPGYWTAGQDNVSTAGGQTAQQTDTTNEYGLTGTSNTPLTENGNWFVGQVVICISPSKTTKSGVPGAWANHNGYTGTNCTTTYFNTAPWGGGSQDSNGTYISVPAV